ncbi:MAG TPA: hypothetical protein VIE41_14250 [Methylomirabilota bacterium]
MRTERAHDPNVDDSLRFRWAAPVPAPGGRPRSRAAHADRHNTAEKFPQPALAITRYARGETVLEAYRKSVAMRGQGVFVGEPLAAPFRAR